MKDINLELLKEEILKKFKEYWPDFSLTIYLNLKISKTNEGLGVVAEILDRSFLEEWFPLEEVDLNKLPDAMALLLYLKILYLDRGELDLSDDFIFKLYSLLKVSGEIKNLKLE